MMWRTRIIQFAFLAGCSFSITGAKAQVVSVCPGDGSDVVVSGAVAPPECTALANPAVELGLSQALLDPAEIARTLAEHERRLESIERYLLLQTRPRPVPRAAVPTQRADPFDTQGRTRDLGQDIERRLEAR